MKREIQLSPHAKRQIQQLGDRIKLARLRRRLSLHEISQRAGISLNTVVAIETGKLGVSIGAVASVLHSLSLVDELSKVALDDVLGRKLQDLELNPRKRAPKKKKAIDLMTLIKKSK